MKRLLLSLAWGVLITVFILGFALVGMFSGPGKDVPDERKVAAVFYFAIAWPLLVLFPIFGTMEVAELTNKNFLCCFFIYLPTHS